MATNSKIEWTDHTFNPWIGCTKVSPGCKHCYAETLMTRKPRWSDTWGPQGTRLKTSDANWRKPLTWNRKAEAEGRRYKVFCGSLCDVFEDKPDQQRDLWEWRGDLCFLIEKTPHLDWLVLTKRPENVGLFPAIAANVWIGTSVENQEQADERIPELLKIPAAVRFLSIESLLGPVDLSVSLGQGVGDLGLDYGRISWTIVGGESGHNRRPMNLDWARSIRGQCNAAGVPFFMKQVDKVIPIPNDLMIREYPALAPVL